MKETRGTNALIRVLSVFLSSLNQLEPNLVGMFVGCNTSRSGELKSKYHLLVGWLVFIVSFIGGGNLRTR
jgi:hypothetical protein